MTEREKLIEQLRDNVPDEQGHTGMHAIADSFDIGKLADYILQREQEAFKRGRIAEAKTCEEAKRHQATPQDSTASKEARDHGRI
jgi:23S rRNA maturation mini-RNase III